MNFEKVDIAPLGNKVICEIIRRETDEEVLESGLILKHDSSKEDVDFARVLAVGPGEMDRNSIFIPTTTQPGQLIAIHKFSGQVFHLKDKEYMVLRESEILGIVKED